MAETLLTNTDTTKLTFDLADITGLAPGTYSVKVLPKGDGAVYSDADLEECVAVLYSILEQLAAPTNVAVDGTIASWDAVEHATVYEAFVDGVSIGEHSVAS